MKVWMSRIIKSFAGIICLITGSASFAKKIPYKTKAILFPTNIVEIYCPGLLINKLMVFEDAEFCFLSSSTLSLLADTKAISIPEKNAEKIKEKIIISIKDRAILLETLVKQAYLSATFVQ